MTRRSVLLAIVLGLLFFPQQAFAEGSDKKQACATSYEAGQRLQRRGALVEARKHLLVCGGMQCPTVMHADCEHWLSQVEASMSTVVFQVLNDAGVEVVGARVAVDRSAPVALRGRALELDPGHHELQFSAEGFEPKTIHYSFSEGQKLRRELVTLKTVQPTNHVLAASDQGSPKPSASPNLGFSHDAGVSQQPGTDLSVDRGASTDAKSSSPGPLGTWPFWVAGSVGALGAASFAYFGVTARNGDTRLGKCEPDCSRHDVDTVRRDYLLANVSLGIGALAFATVGVILIVHPTRSGTPSAQTLRLGLSPVAVGPSAELSF